MGDIYEIVAFSVTILLLTSTVSTYLSTSNFLGRVMPNTNLFKNGLIKESIPCKLESICCQMFVNVKVSVMRIL